MDVTVKLRDFWQNKQMLHNWEEWLDLFNCSLLDSGSLLFILWKIPRVDRRVDYLGPICSPIIFAYFLLNKSSLMSNYGNFDKINKCFLYEERYIIYSIKVCFSGGSSCLVCEKSRGWTGASIIWVINVSRLYWLTF